MRSTPVMIFINKLDRDGKDPFALLDELESLLHISLRPLSWPISQGSSFQGVYNLYKKELNIFEADKTKISEDVIAINDINSSELEKHIPGKHVDQIRTDVELIEEVYEPLDIQMYNDGLLAPVFFGSALNNFGVKELLDTFIEIAPNPQPRHTNIRKVSPNEKDFSGFVFKIHANLDPKHRDRIAFLRICSGKFERNKFYHHTRLNKKFRFSNPTTFMANEKTVTDEAWPGDVVGLYDSGNFKIGDTLSDGENFVYKGIPSFSSEIFREVINLDPMKTKQLEKGLQQLTEEGVAQLFTRTMGAQKIIGTVGELQFEVIKFRLEHEYGAKCNFQHLPYTKACWLYTENKKQQDQFIARKGHNMGLDRDKRPVYFVESEWVLKSAMEGFDDIEFHFTSEWEMERAASS